MLFLYRVAIYILTPFFVLRFVYKGLKNNSLFRRVGERLGFASIRPAEGGFWIHAVSVGEVNAAIPLVSQIAEKWPDRAITVTTMTTTGSERVVNVLGDKVHHCYLPYDYPGAVKRFIRQISPQLGMVMETEIWPNLISRCRAENIPLIYTNVRLSHRSWQGYNRFRRLFEQVLPKINCFAVQSEPDAKRIVQLGAPESRVHVTGSIKFDISVPPSVNEAGEAIRRKLGWNRPVFLAASTHEGEEIIAIETFLEIQKKLPETLLILVPRHPERFAQVSRLCAKYIPRTMNWSEISASNVDQIDGLIVDSMGELTMFIASSDVVFMGGSMVPVGGHNVLEAAALCKPVVFGPYMFNFAEISEMFLQQGAAIQVQEAKELSEVCVRLLDDAVMRDQFGTQGEKIITQNKGALDKVMKLVEEQLS